MDDPFVFCAPHPFLTAPRPVAIAHRGGSLEAEENTAAAFERARALGFYDAELDVHLSRDGHVVVHHDPDLQRFCGDPRRVADLTLAELAGLRSPGGAGVVPLAELLSSLPDMRFIIEMKTDEVVAPLAEVLRRADALRRVCLGSFSSARTLRIRRILGAAVCWSPARAGVAALAASGFGVPFRPGFGVVQVPRSFRGIPVVTPRFLRAAHAKGVAVQVWTVNDRAEMEALLEMGVDGILTDRPTLLREVLQARGLWNPQPAV